MKKRLTQILAATAVLSASVTFAVMQARYADIPAGHWATEAVNFVSSKGLIQGYPDGNFKGNRNLTRYEAAAIFHRLLKSGALNNMNGTDLTVVNKGISDVQAELAALTAREATADKAAQARIAELEAQIKNLSSNTSTVTTPNNSALEARVKSLEDMLVGYKDHEARILALEAAQKANQNYESRIKTLEGQVTDLTTKLNIKPVVTVEPTPQPVTVTPVKPQTQAVALNRDGLFGLGGNIFLGGGVAATAYPLPTSFNPGTDLGGFVQFGVKNLVGPIGLRAYYDGSPLPSAALELMFGSNGLFAPYVTVGGGMMFAGSTQNYFVGGALGANINFTSGIGMFLEGAPEYNLTTNAFGVKARAGLRFSF